MTTETPPPVDIDGLLASGFTEGPWEPRGFEVVVDGDNFADGDDVVISATGCTYRISGTHTVPDKTQSDANTTLQAAAPSLLHLAKAQRDRIADLEARVRELECELLVERSPKGLHRQVRQRAKQILSERAALNKGQTHV